MLLYVVVVVVVVVVVIVVLFASFLIELSSVERARGCAFNALNQIS